MNENFRFLTLKMDSLAQKNDRARCLFFSSVDKTFFMTLLLDRRETQIKVVLFNEHIWQCLMISKNLSIFAVKSLFAAASEMIFGAQRHIYFYP